MAFLVLIKHALPEIEVDRSSRDWVLSDDGRKQCVLLAEMLKAYAPDVCVTSDEPKAQETGRLVANQLTLPWVTMPNLHEHDRSGVPFMDDRDAWHKVVRGLFRRPEDLVFGRETAIQAQDRFLPAVEHVLEAHPDQTVAVASHGTVISLFVAGKAGVDGFDLWQRLGLPSFVVLSIPSFEIIDVVGEIVE